MALRLEDKPWLDATVDFDALKEHCIGTHPPTGLVVEGPIDDYCFERLAIAGDAHHFVLATLVVTVSAEFGFGQSRQVVHGTK